MILVLVVIDAYPQLFRCAPEEAERRVQQWCELHPHYESAQYATSFAALDELVPKEMYECCGGDCCYLYVV